MDEQLDRPTKIKCREDVKSSGKDQIGKMYLLKDSDVKAQGLN